MHRIDTPDRLDPQLELLMVEAAPPLDLDELSGVECLSEDVDVAEHLARNLSRRILQHDRQKIAAVASGPNLLAGAQVKSPADGRFVQFRDRGQMGHRL